jgi:hypothetical protein
MKNLLILFLFLSGCCCNEAQKAPLAQQQQQQQQKEVVVVRGPAETRWEETMHDTVKVPGKIDPTKTYYRAPHQTVVEIRQGKHQPVRFSGE